MSIKTRLFLILTIVLLVSLTGYYRALYKSEQRNYQHAINDYNALRASFNNYKEKTQKINQLDKQIHEELESAKRENDNLRNQLDSGAVGVYIDTINTTTVRDTAPACVVNETRARLSNSNEQDFFNLKERAEQSKIMIEGLQQYINQVCLKENN